MDILLLVGVVIFNVLLLVIFKLYDRFSIDTFQAIVVNYWTAVILGSCLLGYFPLTDSVTTKPWFIYALILGFLFISGFTLLGKTVQLVGVAVTSVAQKMSFIIALVFSILWYQEQVTVVKIIGLILAAICILFINKPNKDVQFERSTKMVTYILGTFILGGIIDCLLFYVERENISKQADIGFLTTLFGIAGIIGLLYMIYGLITKKLTWQWKNVYAGIILGIPNFFSIYLLLLLINTGFEGSKLFPIVNVSNVCTSTLMGLLLFREKLNTIQWIGVALGISCILLIAL